MKKLLGVIIVLILLLAIAGLLAPYFISSDTVKLTVIAKVEAATGRKLTIGGKFSVRFFPIAGVSMEDVSLSNPQGWPGNSQFVVLKALSVDVAVMPLLHGGVDIQGLVLDEPRINLYVSKNGVKNWEFSKAAAAGNAGEKTSSGAAAGPTNLSLSNVKLKNGTVTYVDEAAKGKWTVQKLNAEVSLAGMSSPFKVDGKGEWNGKAVKIKTELDSLESFLLHRRTKVEMAVDSDLLVVNGGGTIENERFTGKAEVKSSSLKSLMVWANPASKPIGTPAPLALTIESAVSCSSADCNFTNASLKLDKIEAKGNVKVAFGGDVPQVGLNVTTGILDFNPFLTQHADAGGWIPDAVAAETWSDAPLDLSGLKAVDLAADIKTGGIIWHKFTIGKTALRATISQGRLNANVVDAELYEGKGNLSFGADASGAVATYADLKGIQAEKLLKDAAGIDKLSGTADVQLNVSGRGRSEREIVSSLAGNGQVKLNNGVLRGTNILDMMHNIQSAFGKAGASSQQTPIENAGGTFTIAQGILTNKDLAISMPGMRASGQGTVNLPAYSINYRLTPQQVSAVKGQDGTTTQKEGLAVPLLISGSLDHPQYGPDVGSIVQQVIENPKQLKEQLRNSKGDIKEQLKGLKGLFKQK